MYKTARIYEEILAKDFIEAPLSEQRIVQDNLSDYTFAYIAILAAAGLELRGGPYTNGEATIIEIATAMSAAIKVHQEDPELDNDEVLATFTDELVKLTPTQKEKIIKIKEKVRNWKREKTTQYTPPRYDEVFYKGVEWLDKQ